MYDDDDYDDNILCLCMNNWNEHVTENDSFIPWKDGIEHKISQEIDNATLSFCIEVKIRLMWLIIQ